MEVLGLSLITNLAAGISPTPLQSFRRSSKAGRDAEPVMQRPARAASCRAVGPRDEPRSTTAKRVDRPGPRPRSHARSSPALIDGAEAGEAPALAALADRFGSRLTFGTAGLRGRARGPGPTASEPRARRAGRGRAFARFLVQAGDGVGRSARRASSSATTGAPTSNVLTPAVHPRSSWRGARSACQS